METTTETGIIGKEKLMTDLRAVVTDAEELLRATANQTGERVTAARARAAESLNAAKERLAEAQANAVENARAAARATDEYVHENPWKAMGVAAIVGLLLGAVISHRR